MLRVYLVGMATLLLVITGTVQADSSPEKQEAINEFLGQSSPNAQINQTIEGVARLTVMQDPRIKFYDKPAFAKTLAQSVSRQQMKEELGKLVDQNFTAEEIQAIVKFRRSALGQKIDIVFPKMGDELTAYAKALTKERFEPVTHMPYVDPTAPDPHPPGEPGWFTKLIWNTIPSTRACPKR